MAVNIAIECVGGPEDGRIIRVDQHENLKAYRTFDTDTFEYVYKLVEDADDQGFLNIYYRFALAMRLKRFDKPASDQWPDVDEIY